MNIEKVNSLRLETDEGIRKQRNIKIQSLFKIS